MLIVYKMPLNSNISETPYLYIWNTEDLSFSKVTVNKVGELLVKGYPIYGAVIGSSGSIEVVPWYPGVFESRGINIGWEGSNKIVVASNMGVCDILNFNGYMYFNGIIVDNCYSLFCPVLYDSDMYIYYTDDGHTLRRKLLHWR